MIETDNIITSAHDVKFQVKQVWFIWWQATIFPMSEFDNAIKENDNCLTN